MATFMCCAADMVCCFDVFSYYLCGGKVMIDLLQADRGDCGSFNFIASTEDVPPMLQIQCKEKIFQQKGEKGFGFLMDGSRIQLAMGAELQGAHNLTIQVDRNRCTSSLSTMQVPRDICFTKSSQSKRVLHKYTR